jgi:hypothetical protein
MDCFKICNQIQLIYFIKFVVHKINSEMIKSVIVMLIEKENINVTDTNIAII